MSRLYDVLADRDIGDILEPCLYEYKGFVNDERLFKELDFIIENNKRLLVKGDPDPDGLFSIKIVEAAFNRCGYTNYEIFRYTSRSHNLTDDCIDKVIYEKFDYILILDSSSNDMTNINKFDYFGIKTIIIDHHICNYTFSAYPDSCIIINSSMDNVERREDFYKLSAGAVTFCLMAEYLNRKKKTWVDLSAYALITLYSDSIDMTREVNRGIYYLATGLPTEALPIYVRHFLNDYTRFTRRFIEFTFVPKINALFRAEHFKIINEYILEDHTSVYNYNYIIGVITEIYEEARRMVDMATDTIKYKNLENIVVANLNSCSIPVKINKLYNYTGLVANNLSSKFGKPCVVLCDADTHIKGSFRDLYSRDYLRTFKQFCKAEGHNAAFGIKLEYVEYSDFMFYIEEKINKKFFILGIEEPIQLEMNTIVPDLELLSDIALYNEFSGNEIPIIIVSKKNNLRSNRSYSSNSNYSYKWGDLKIDSTSYIPSGMELLIKPILTKKLKLVTVNRNAMI